LSSILTSNVRTVFYGKCHFAERIGVGRYGHRTADAVPIPSVAVGAHEAECWSARIAAMPGQDNFARIGTIIEVPSRLSVHPLYRTA
jgi:hypothetical protein